jgi:hypothetical protein
MEERGFPAPMIYTRGVVGTGLRAPKARIFMEEQIRKCRDIKRRIDDLTMNVVTGKRLRTLDLSSEERYGLIELQKELIVHKCNCLEEVV